MCGLLRCLPGGFLLIGFVLTDIVFFFFFLKETSLFMHACSNLGSPGGSVVKNPPQNARGAGDSGLTPGLGRFPGGEHGNPLQYSCPENPTERAWRARVHGVRRVGRLSTQARGNTDGTAPPVVQAKRPNH